MLAGGGGDSVKMGGGCSDHAADDDRGSRGRAGGVGGAGIVDVADDDGISS